MAKNIALEVTLGGVQKSISSLQEFEKELQKLQEELGITGQDSLKTFDLMSSEITQVNNDFKMLTENIEDVNFGQTVDQFTQVGDAITETFGTAQGAIQEFGNETDVVAMTSKKALDQVTKSSFSVSGSLSDMSEKFQKIPGPIGQVAQGISGLAQGFKILLANPIGLFLAGIAVIFTTLYKALTSTEKGLFKFREVMGALQGVIDPILKLLQNVALVLVDGVLAGIEAVQKGLELLGFEKFAEASRDARDLARSINEVEEAEGDLNVERAKQNKELAEFREILSDTNISLAERRKALEQVKKSEEDLSNREVQLSEKRLANIREEIKQKGASEELNTKEENALISLFNTQQNQANVRRKNIKADQALVREAEAETKRLETEKAQRQKENADKRKLEIETIKKLTIDALTLEITKQKELRYIITAPIPEPVVLSTLRSISQTQSDLISQFKKPIFADLINDFKNVAPPVTEASNSVDAFGKIYFEARKKLSQSAQQGTVEFDRASRELNQTFFEAFSVGEITLEALNAFRDIDKAYRSLNETIFQTGEAVFDPTKFYQLYKDVKIVNGQIINDINKSGEVSRAITSKSVEDALGDFQVYENELRKNYGKFLMDTRADIKKGLDLGDPAIEKQFKDLIDTYIDGIKETSDGIIKQEQTIGKFYAEATQLQTERQKQQNFATLGFIAQNTDLLIGELVQQFGLYEGLTEEAFKNIVESNVDVTNLTQEELDALFLLYEQFYEKLGILRKKDGDDEDDEQKKRRERRLSNIQGLSQQLGEVSATLSQFSAFALEKLAQDEQTALAGIIGTTEQANQKRLELAQQYEGKRLQIEKQTRIQELEFARIQAIAEGAVAVIRSASTPILIPLTVALVAAQVSLITSQLQQARSLQRGGLLQMGGLLEGPSHNEGGIRYGQMGVELEGGEAVINRVSTSQYGSLLSTINQAGGGRPLVSSQFDDSRLLEALAKQRSEPIRAYVLEQEITNKQAINTRLESLSTL